MQKPTRPRARRELLLRPGAHCPSNLDTGGVGGSACGSDGSVTGSPEFWARVHILHATSGCFPPDPLAATPPPSLCNACFLRASLPSLCPLVLLAACLHRNNRLLAAGTPNGTQKRSEAALALADKLSVCDSATQPGKLSTSVERLPIGHASKRICRLNIEHAAHCNASPAMTSRHSVKGRLSTLIKHI